MVDRINILAADIKTEDIQIIESVLKAPGINIVNTSIESMELSLMREPEPAIVILDIDMPGINGFKAAEILRSSERTCSIPIIFIVGDDTMERDVFKNFDAGTVDCILRPVEPAILKSRAKVFIDIYTQKRLLKAQAETLEKQVNKLMELKKANRQIQDLTLMDPLTNIPNRRYFEKYFVKQWRNCVRIKSYISVVMIDIDNFKAYNDNYGHIEGDECLKRVAKTIENTIKRPLDQVFRYGGEEFTVILPGANLQGAVSVAESIISNVESLKIVHGFSKVSEYVTISLGVAAVIPTPDYSSNEFIKAADRTMYDAKQQGKNRIVGIEYCSLPGDGSKK